ncbi:hypothetical protein, partial [Mesorhizobium sp. M0199]|uniref:hypothetical protein n=1 Tax=Mesorhizobium sp. M0199 TaxID=2956911 RepID=UPI003338B680
MLRMDIDLVLPHIPFVDVGRCRSSRSATTSIMIGRYPDGSDWLAFDKCLYSLDECSGGSICRIVRIPPYASGEDRRRAHPAARRTGVLGSSFLWGDAMIFFEEEFDLLDAFI